MTTKDIIAEINDLPVEQRVDILNQILQDMNTSDPEIEKTWAEEARRRLDEFEEGKVKAIPGDQFDREVQELEKRYSE
ncbi:addiction module protein [Rhodohalobacter sp. SW132]|uniref:addiction module protein n=1 Tax=Rhodohalobacter sp. SW132 TaxID=2293433 RepID=UPI000E22E182|nr:addiction module protein [Rhodohalobacter sp. SW132]REL37891.1 addiction module protein [Rhodohalobacter sp. SW132]